MRAVYLRRLDALRAKARETWPFSLLLAVVAYLAYALLGALAQWIATGGAA